MKQSPIPEISPSPSSSVGSCSCVVSVASPAKSLEYFTPLVRKAIQLTISEQITDRLKTALVAEELSLPTTTPASELPAAVADGKTGPTVVTTAEELEGFYIVRAILRSQIAADRIVHRDAQSYFAILLDDNNRKPICRLNFNGQKKFITLFDEAKKEIRHELTSLDDIFSHSDALNKTLTSYISG